MFTEREAERVRDNCNQVSTSIAVQIIGRYKCTRICTLDYRPVARIIERVCVCWGGAGGGGGGCGGGGRGCG